MKYAAVLLSLFVIMTGFRAADGQELLPVPRAANPPIQIAGASNDQLLQAYTIYPDVSLTVLGVHTATLQTGEVAHACAKPAPTAGKHSIWFATYLPAGKLTVKTNGTAYVTSGGVSDDTVVSVYRLTGNQSTINFTTLAPVGCGRGGTGAGSVKGLAVREGTYLIQVSMESGTALGGSTVSLRALFDATEAVPGEVPETARSLTFPANKVVSSISFAKAELDEPIDAFLPPGTTISRSIWYKFELESRMRLLAGLTGYMSLFRVNANGELIPVKFSASISDGNGLRPGRYFLRVAMPAEQLPIGQLDDQLFVAQMSVVPVLSPVNIGFGVKEGSAGASASLEGWTLKGATPAGQPNADGLICGFTANKCGLQLISQGPGEATRVIGTITLKNVRLKRYELMLLGAAGLSTGDGRVRIKAIMWDASGARLVLQRVMYPSTTGLALNGFETLPHAFTPVRVKLIITNLSQHAGDKAILDEVALVAYRLGDPARGKPSD
jgi:hypothetical protein